MYLLISFWWDMGIILSILVLSALIWANRRYKYWKKLGVTGPEPQYLFGNVREMITAQKNIGLVFSEMYEKYKREPFFGVYMMFRPTLVVNDPNLIKTLMVKDFNSFMDHLFEFDPNYEPLGEHLFNASGEKWRTMRQKLTPTFTSNKMKYMFETLKDCSRDLDRHLAKTTEMSAEVNVKEVLALFGMNVIGSCAFGVECNAFEDSDSKFVKFGKGFFEKTTFHAALENCVLFCLPDVCKNLKFSILGNGTTKFFYNLLNDTIQYRNSNNIKRNDFLQILMQLHDHGRVEDKDEKDEKFTTMQLAAQVFVFFIAGFETSSTAASYALYELALNPDIQDKVREEIDEVLEKNGGNITYESLSEMSYLTKVVEETLRKYPPLPVLMRKCIQTYKIPGSNVTIEPGTPVIFPIFAIQRDPQYYPNPEKFDPERFSPENKANRDGFSYLPFGEGPRICIGSRFGLMQTKLGLVSILSKYSVLKCKKTEIPITYDEKNLLIISKNGIWLKLVKNQH